MIIEILEIYVLNNAILYIGNIILLSINSVYRCLDQSVVQFNSLIKLYAIVKIKEIKNNNY